MKRIKALTILELVIVMIITSFIVIAGYFAYSSSALRLHLFELSAAKNVELMQLDLLIRKDFAESTSAILTSSIQLQLLKSDTGEVVYVFGNDNVSRQTRLNSYVFNIKIKNVTSTNLEFNSTYVSQLNLSVQYDGKANISLNYLKDYDPFFYINHQSK